MCRLQNIAMRGYQEGVTTGQTDKRQMDAGQSDPYVLLCFAGDTIKIVAAFRGIHVSPAKYTYA